MLSNIKLCETKIYQRYPRKNQYNCLLFLATLYVTFGISCPTLLGNKLIQTPLGVMSATSIAGPFWFTLGDVIAEVYGFRVAKKLFVLGAIIEIIFILLCNFFIVLKTNFIQSYYIDLFQYKLGDNVTGLLAIIIAWYVNTYLLIKWKILTRGKYFWLRSVGSSTIGIIIYSLARLPAWYIFNFVSTFNQAYELAFWACTLKIIFIALLAIPVSYLVKFLKIIESNIENLTPFKAQSKVTYE